VKLSAIFHRAALTASLLLSACVAGPNYRRPPLPPSASYGADAVAPSYLPGGPQLAMGMDIPAQWWRIFHCADLDALIAQALENNPTIASAKAALKSARELAKAQKGAYYPSVALSLQPSHQNFARDLSSPTASGASDYDLTTAQVSVAYTPDLFGANRRAVEALIAQQDQERFELEAARLTLAANVAMAAIQDALLRQEIESTKTIIAFQQKTLDSYKAQYTLGQVSRADVALQEALLGQSQAGLPPLVKQFRVNRDLLSALVGQTPGESLDVKFEFKSLTLPEHLPLSLPAQLVRQRPDVRIAEAELHAASAQIGVAVAARLPNIQIDAIGGSAALALTPSFNSAADFWSLAATLTQPLFAGGTLRHRERAARANYDQAAAEYRGTVVGAFQNTADVLQALWTDAEALRAAEFSATASARSLEIARRQVELGDANRLALLAAQTTDAQARLTALQARANRYDDVVALFQALGGGWWSENTTA
jgi:NodT family efflux transporter outer membrane factor (OMF) lipoprotein